MMKILKLITQPRPKLTSYNIKYAVQMVLANMTPTDNQIGECIRKVFEFETMKGRFDSIHEELAEMGLERVEVTNKGLQFVGKT